MRKYFFLLVALTTFSFVSSAQSEAPQSPGGSTVSEVPAISIETLNQADLAYSRGMKQLKKERFDKALFYFNEAIKLNPTKGIYYYYRGDLLFEFNNPKKGCADMRKALELNFESAKEVITKECGDL